MESRMGRMGRMGTTLIVFVLLFLPALPARPAFPALNAQHAAFRVRGRVTNDRGEPMKAAEVKLEAFYGYFAGTFAGQRTYSTTTDAKGIWSVGAMQPGVWLFEV